MSYGYVPFALDPTNPQALIMTALQAPNVLLISIQLHAAELLAIIVAFREDAHEAEALNFVVLCLRAWGGF